jgi:glycosyltransferase involved in cell wall biosynthesis
VKVAMLGTRGVPARYGGFETAVEEIGRRMVADGHRVVVYCRNPGQTRTEHLGMELVNLPSMRKRSLETLSHTGLSVAHAVRHRPDAAVLFNAGNAPYIPVLKAARIPTAVHVDGLEWKRAKWQGAGARYYRWAERSAARSGVPLIADAQGIADHLRETYGVDSHVIPYGAPILHPGHDRLAELGLSPHAYHLVVARLEPENHVDVIVRGYVDAASPHPLVVVGSAPYADAHVTEIRAAAGDSDTRFVGAVWDQDLLNQLYAGSLSYLHGHSVGGTNPSLLRALGCAAPVTAFDVNFNREVSAGHARFFDDASSVAAALRADEQDPDDAVARGRGGQAHVAATYRWDDVAEDYVRLLSSMCRR